MEWLLDLFNLAVHLLQAGAGLVLVWGAYLAISQKVEERAAPRGWRPANRGTAFEGRPFRAA
ncbi:MAG TPA: hypothetical protein VGF58_05380 [Burkholderiales bacterium]|jgi:hypothetical protein